jgi:hypothetical protein
MQIDPVIQEKLISEITRINENIELTKLALTDILDEDDLKNLLDYYYYQRVFIRICAKIEPISDNKIYRLKLLWQDGDIIDNYVIKYILDNYCPITKTVKATANIAVRLCKNNTIIGYNMWPYFWLFHMDDIHSIFQGCQK